MNNALALQSKSESHLEDGGKPTHQKRVDTLGVSREVQQTRRVASRTTFRFMTRTIPYLRSNKSFRKACILLSFILVNTELSQTL